MNNILFTVFLLLILMVAVYLIYLYLKRKTDAKAIRLMYLTAFLGAIINAGWLVVHKFFTITDAINDWVIYTESIFIILIIVEVIYAGATKKNKTPQQKILFKVGLGFFIIALIAFVVLVLLIAT